MVAIPIFALAETLPHPDPERRAFYAVLGLYALFAAFALVRTRRAVSGSEFGLAATAVDVVAVTVLAALSGGAFSPARSAFFVIPVTVAFRFTPALTAAAAAATLLAYLVQALAHPTSDVPQAGTEIAVRAGFLAWIGLSATVLSRLLERRTSRVVALTSERARLERRYRELFHGVPLGLFRLDAGGALVEANPALRELLDGAPGLPLPRGGRDGWRRAAEDGRLRGVEFETDELPGGRRWLRTTGRAVRDESGRTTGYEGSLEDVSERRRAHEELEAHARRQEALARIAERSVAAQDLDTFLADTVSLVKRTLAVDYCKVLEKLPHQHGLLLRAGSGWQQGLVGSACVGAERESQAGFTILTEEPVVTADLERETRFRPPPLLVDHDVRSGVSVLIGRLEEPYGVIGVHHRLPRTFGTDEVHFLRGVAGLIGSTVERERADAALEQSRTRFAASRRRLLADALAAEERERQLLAESLHDHAIQALLAAQQDLDEAAAGDAGAFERAGAALAGTIHDLREAIFELDPRVSVQAGLGPALRAAAGRAARRSGFELRADIPDGTFPHEQLLLGAARQLLANAAEHARARRVSLRLAHRAGAVTLTVADDGAGFDPETLTDKLAAGHIGLASQRERVESAGGVLRIRSAAGAGTVIRISLPG